MTDAPTTPDPIEIAMEAEAAGAPPSGIAAELLRRQSRLVGWQIARERAGFALRILAGAAGLAVAGALGLMCWNASRADGLVVEAFLTPPDLAQQGMTGEAVARGVLDRLAELDRATNSVVATRVADAWTRNIKIEVAQTGISLDDIDRLLRRWLGHETYLSGEAMRTAHGVRLVARSGAGHPAVVEGPVETYPALIQALGEAVYRRARPLGYAELAIREGRRAEGRQVIEEVLRTTTDPLDRSLGHILAGLSLDEENRSAEAIEHYKITLAGSDRALATFAAANLANVYRNQGRLALSRTYVDRVTALASRSSGRLTPDLVANFRGRTTQMLRYDYAGAEQTLRPLAGRLLPGAPAASNSWINYGQTLAFLHRTRAAQRLVPDPAPTAAIANDDWASALASIDRRVAAGRPLAPGAAAVQIIALARLGRLDEARTKLPSLPADCDMCFVARGYVAGAAGDAAGADRAFAEAVRLAPRDAWIRLMIGRDRLLRGDPDRAASDFAESAGLASRWADPLAFWGEALLVQGDAAGAAARFARAEPLAPSWARLHLKCGEALAKLGKSAEARAQYRAAGTLDLTPDERAELTRVIR